MAATGTVYRPVARDRHGDPVDADGEIVELAGESVAKLGTLDIILGGPANSTLASVPQPQLRGYVVSVDGMLGWKVGSEIDLEAGDIVEVCGSRFLVRGNVLWGNRPHGLTGSPPRYKWIAAVAA